MDYVLVDRNILILVGILVYVRYVYHQTLRSVSHRTTVWGYTVSRDSCTKDFPKEIYCTPYLSLVPLKMKFKMNLTINTRWRNSI